MKSCTAIAFFSEVFALSAVTVDVTGRGAGFGSVAPATAGARTPAAATTAAAKLRRRRCWKERVVEWLTFIVVDDALIGVRGSMLSVTYRS
jgi:hypothetical protein